MDQQRKVTQPAPLRISVVMPVWQEEAFLPRSLESLQVLEEGLEIVVVDGDPAGSSLRVIDDPEVVRLIAPKGRANQMNAGARQATGDVLLFLHADTTLPLGALEAIRGALAETKTVGGAFSPIFDSRMAFFRLLAWCHTWRARITRIPYGDQAIFIRREVFFGLGGYPEEPWLEDILLMRQVRRAGKVVILPDRAVTSARRFQNEGILRTAWRYAAAMILSFFGVRPRILRRLFPDA
ncbi:MAG: TIGR04283 family arsenosugar biosynthesis glycosyltransferase [bacterium]